jgi:hypothetical protein
MSRSSGNTTPGTIVYVHGASDRPPGVAVQVALIESQLPVLGNPFRVVASQWGEAAGARLDRIGLAVPDPGLEANLASREHPLRFLVTDDPRSRLRAIGGTGRRRPVGGGLDDERASDRLLACARLSDGWPDLGPAGAAMAVRDAARSIAASVDYQRARSGTSSDLELVRETAWALSAEAATDLERGGPRAELIERRLTLARSIEQRLAEAVLALAVGTLLVGYAGLDPGPEVRRWATDTMLPHRVPMMRSVLPGPADILVYLHSGSAIRRFVRQTLDAAAASRPVIAMGSSLGAVILFDALREDGSSRPDLMVTVGSQSPLLELLGALMDGGPNPPYQPWLNIHDRRDLLGFVAQPVWPDQPGITDVEVDMDVGFPDSHGQTYLGAPQVYGAIRDHMASLGISSAPSRRSR